MNVSGRDYHGSRDLLAQFNAQTGIRVNSQPYDSLAALVAVLLPQ